MISKQEQNIIDPVLTPKFLETSEISETDEVYSGYLRCSSTIDGVRDSGIIEWEQC